MEAAAPPLLRTPLRAFQVRYVHANDQPEWVISEPTIPIGQAYVSGWPDDAVNHPEGVELSWVRFAHLRAAVARGWTGIIRRAMEKQLEKRMSPDSELQQAVLAELNWEPSVIASHIGVTAKAGVVSLSGHVASYVEKHAAEKAARRVKGVRAVAEELEVRLPSDIDRDDADIAEAALDRLSWDVSVPKDSVKIQVEKGLITLTGTVDWHYQRAAVKRDVGGLYGVTDVVNLIALRPRVNVPNLSNDITLALHRSWLDPKTIKVGAEGGKVHLTGTVRSWHDRDEAESTSWGAPGVSDVKNDITVLF